MNPFEQIIERELADHPEWGASITQGLDDAVNGIPVPGVPGLTVGDVRKPIGVLTSIGSNLGPFLVGIMLFLLGAGMLIFKFGEDIAGSIERIANSASKLPIPPVE